MYGRLKAVSFRLDYCIRVVLASDSFMALLELVRYRREAKESATKVAALSKLMENEHATVRQVRRSLLLHTVAVPISPAPLD